MPATPTNNPRNYQPGATVYTRAGGFLRWQRGTYEGTDPKTGLRRVRVGKSVFLADAGEVWY
jgi:hypothetical protein